MRTTLIMLIAQVLALTGARGVTNATMDDPLSQHNSSRAISPVRDFSEEGLPQSRRVDSRYGQGTPRSGSILVVSDKDTTFWNARLSGNGLNPVFGSSYPADLSGFTVVVVDLAAASNPPTASLLGGFVSSGGGVLVTEGNPYFLGIGSAEM